MNPFNWNGPEFLAFYLILTVVLITAQVWMRRMRETEAHAPGSTPKLTDPYLVAYLAGGANALIRCVMVSLLERKVLTVPSKLENEVVMNQSQAPLLKSPLEGLVARFFETRRAAHDVFKNLATAPQLAAATAEYQSGLEAAGLLPSAQQRAANLSNAWIVALLLAVVAGWKVYLALERGHRNIWFLVVLGVIACIVSLSLSGRRLTKPGREALADLKLLFGGLKQKTTKGATVSAGEVALVAAVFGLGVLGPGRELYAKSLFPAAASSSGCGSSCGSSSSGDSGGGDSGGGSSCGGGSGCGGCGSS